jgi:predicted ribosome quality control (RQC) complex YloA/Tae2 family protein
MGSYNADVTLTDFKLLAWGRHFRINPQVKVVVSRNESENNIIENIATPEDYYMHMAEIPGPVALINKGNCSISDLELAASILVRFSKARNESEVAVKVFNNSKEQIIRVSPASEDVCEKIRI